MSRSMSGPVVHRPTSVAAAAQLIDAGVVPLAGATWVMRRQVETAYAALCGLRELRGVQNVAANGSGGLWVIGAMTTHTELAGWAAPPALAALRTAAAESAFPQVRNVATVGGNIGAAGFAQADLIPPLLALDARVRRVRQDREETVGLADHMLQRPTGTLVLAVELDAPPGLRSGFARLTVRGGGEYAVASVALAVRRDDHGSVTAARIAVGSVEAVARRCPRTEAALVGLPLTVESARAAGADAAHDLTPRDDHDAPGWYRTAVLPTLFERAAAQILGEEP